MVESESFDNQSSDTPDSEEVLGADEALHAEGTADVTDRSLDASEPVIGEVAEGIDNNNPYRDASDFLRSPTKLAGAYKEVSVPDLDQELQSMSAKGGAVGGFVLGVWSIICSLITYFGFINAAIAIVLGVYGLNSSRRGLAMLGILLGICGLFMSLMEINEVVSDYLVNQQDAREDF